MSWRIVPGQGVGPLRFGMTQAAVAAVPVAGRPSHVYRGSGERLMEYRGLAVPVCEYLRGGLCRVIAGRHVAGLQLDGIDLFGTAPAKVLRALEKRLGAPRLCQEQLCFSGAGLMLGGFYDAGDHRFFEPAVEYHDERSVTLYPPGPCGLPGEAEEEVVSFL